MLDTIGGIPLHPLIVHAVVVLVPLSCLLLLLSAVSARIRRWAGILTPVTATVALALVPLASQSGETLQRRVQATPALEEHTELGDTLIYFVLLVAVFAWALWFLDRRARTAAANTVAAEDGSSAAVTGRRSPAMTAVIVLSVVSVLATGVQVFRIGHSGAAATWQETGQQPLPAGGGDGDD